jgi:hypothetical protein
LTVVAAILGGSEGKTIKRCPLNENGFYISLYMKSNRKDFVALF